MHRNCPVCDTVMCTDSWHGYPVRTCPQCTLVSSLGFFSAQDYDDYHHTSPFRSNFKEYVRIARVSLYEKVHYLALNSHIGNPNYSFLDVGCGPGVYLEAAGFLGWRAKGVDPDRVNSKWGVDRGLHIHTGSLTSANYDSASVDFVQCKQVLEHIATPIETLSEVYRILAPGGLVQVDVPNQRSLSARAKIWARRHDYGFIQPPRHVLAYNATSMHYALSIAGFQVCDVFNSYPGDSVYYPLPGRQRSYLLHRLASSLSLGSVLVAYARKPAYAPA